MTNRIAIFTSLLTSKEHTVKELAAATLLSESRVREILKGLPGVLSSGTKPARFSIAPEAPAPAEDDAEGCPFCNAGSSSITAAGQEGTFLGDSVNLCHGCGGAFHRFTKAKVDLPKSKGGKGKGRRLANPQHKINAKVAAVEAVGGTLEYNRVSRVWVMSLPNQQDVVMDSRTFASYTPETLIPEALRK